MQKKYKESFWSYIIVFFLLYITSSYYITVGNKIPGVVSVLSLFFIIIVGGFLDKRNSIITINAKSFMLLLFMMIVALVSCLINHDDIYHYAILIFAVVSGYLITFYYSFDEFVIVFLKVMYFLSIFSLVLFLVVSIYPSIVHYAPIIGQREGISVYNLGFAVTLPGAEFNRNYGLFWEPGAFQTYLNLALIFELFIYERIRMKYVLIFIVAIATTFSTTGYIALAVILIAFIFNNKIIVVKYKQTYKCVAAIIVVVFMGLNFMPTDYTYLLFGKLNGLFSEGGSSNFSTTVRINAIIYPYYEFIKSPLIGIGYEKYLSMAAEYLYTMPTCTLINWYALFGILWGIPCSYYYLRNTLRFNCGLLSRCLLIIALLIIIISEDYIRIAFIYVLIFYGVNNIKRNEERAV